MDFREGVVVNPYLRLNHEEINKIHKASMEILMNPGVIVFHKEAAKHFKEAGAEVIEAPEEGEAWSVKIPEALLDKALKTVPKKVVLGARDPKNRLVIDGEKPRVYFGTGSETNYILETCMDTYVKKDEPETTAVIPTYKKKRGTLKDLCEIARLGENLENLDFFIRPVNIQDPEVTNENKDVNKFFACLDNITKHVLAGLTDVRQLDNVIKMAEIIAGGKEALKENPVLSFISCVTKSPLQLTEESTTNMLAVNKKGFPIVISSSPQGGSTAPIDEIGIVSQINAEILSAIVLSQIANPGCPVIYGSVPVRARMDNLHDMYGAPEFSQFNKSCVQMARFYGLPCYSSAGVSDAKTPGVRASVEKMLSHLSVSQAGPHLLHYSFGLLEETQTFCPEQAVLDNAHIGMIKKVYSELNVTDEKVEDNLKVIRKVMKSPYRIYAKYARKKLHSGELYMEYPFESDREDMDETVAKAKEEKERILNLSAKKLPEDVRNKVLEEVPGILEKLH